MRRAVAVGVVVTLTLTGCSDDGRDLAEPSADQTTTLPTTSSTGPVIVPMAFSSPAFAAGAPIPAQYTCDGANVSPPLAWSDVPADAIELAVVVTDPDAGAFVHWVVAGIDPATTGLEEDGVPEGATETRNDSGEIGWFGPCPPAGIHTYVFTLYALFEPSLLDPAIQPLDAAAAVQESAVATATFSAVYERG